MEKNLWEAFNSKLNKFKPLGEFGEALEAEAQTAGLTALEAVEVPAVPICSCCVGSDRPVGEAGSQNDSAWFGLDTIESEAI